MKTAYTISLAVLILMGSGSGTLQESMVEAAPGDSPKATAEKVVRSTGINAGLCVHLNCTDGRLTAELAKHGKFVVHGIASTQDRTAKARLHIQSRNLHGTVSVERGSLSRLPYVDNLVNLVVVDDLAEALKAGLSLAEVIRVLCPNGVAYLGTTRQDDLKASLAEAGVKGFEIIKQDDTWTVIRKKRPARMDEWTHWLHGPECSSLSSDSLVGPAGRLQWIDGPYWPMGVTRGAVFAGGRSFTVVPKGYVRGASLWTLVARDACNGLTSWKRDIGPVKRFDPRLLIADDGRVFIVMKDGGALVALDAASGETVKTYDVGIYPKTILYHDGYLILGTEKEICSVNAETGAVRWKQTAPENGPFRYRSAVTYGRYPYLVLGGGRLFIAIEDAPGPPYSLVCYDPVSGKEEWRKKHPGDLLKHYKGVLALLDQPEKFSYSKKTLGTIRGVSTEDGRTLWEHPNVLGIHADGAVFCSGGLFWVNDDKKGLVGLEPATGAVKEQFKGRITGHCGFVRTTDRYFIGVYDSFFDRTTGKRAGGSMAFKNTCFLGNVPANGLVYNFPVYCGCLPYLRGFLAFAPAPSKKPDEAADEEEERLEKGPAYSLALRPARVNLPPEWNTYRHDTRRSGTTAEALPRNLKVLWSRSITDSERTQHGKSLTPPVVAEGKVFVAAPDAHGVCALDVKTGEVRWRYLLDGRVEVPPTIHRGFCLFAANDGRVYCLRASDGEVVWRFRAAPQERRIMVGGRLESPWPVPGVLVEKGVAYFASGRHSAMGDGILVYAMEPATGKVLWQRRVSVKGKMTVKRKKQGWSDRLHANDLLISSGKWLFMGRMMFDPGSGELCMDWRDERYLCSGNARSGRGLVPFGFLNDRKDAAQRYPKHYTPIRYQKTLWSYGGAEGLVLAFTREKVFGVTGEKKKGSQYYTGTEWRLFARRIDGKTAPAKDASVWSVEVPRGSVQALLPAGQVLLVAGPAKEGGMLTSYSVKDGKKLNELRFDGTPIFDGVAATGGRLYVTTQKGKVFCFGGK